jgi:hypothetical protein
MVQFHSLRCHFPKKPEPQQHIMNATEYKEMFAKVQAGQITQEVWFDYCFQTLSQIMEDNKDVFARLKNR